MAVNREEYKSEPITFFTFCPKLPGFFPQGDVGHLPKEKTAEISESRRCALSKPDG
jgi:hypothetical protein